MFYGHGRYDESRTQEPPMSRTAFDPPAQASPPEKAEPPEDMVSKSEMVARLVEADPHQWSTRPCGTCTQVTAVLGRPFGCLAKAVAADHRRREEIRQAAATGGGK